MISCVSGEALASSYKRSLQTESDIVTVFWTRHDFDNLLVIKVLFLTECHSGQIYFYFCTERVAQDGGPHLYCLMLSSRHSTPRISRVVDDLVTLHPAYLVKINTPVKRPQQACEPEALVRRHRAVLQYTPDHAAAVSQ